jgi:hypothetical protein
MKSTTKNTNGKVTISSDGIRKLKRRKYAAQIEMKQINKSPKKMIQTGAFGRSKVMVSKIAIFDT